MMEFVGELIVCAWTLTSCEGQKVNSTSVLKDVTGRSANASIFCTVTKSKVIHVMGVLEVQ